MLRGLVLCLLAACGEANNPPPAEFGLRVVPRSMRALAGQRCVVLVQTTLPPTVRSATIAVVADAPFNLVGRELPGGGVVSEIEVDPDGAVEWVRVVARGDYRGESAAAEAFIEVVGGADHSSAEGRARLQLFLPYLEERYPDEGFDAVARWTGAPVSGGVAARYLFFSTRWEAGLKWQSDSTRLYLRRRFAEARPSLAFRMRSVDSEPVPCAPPAGVDR